MPKKKDATGFKAKIRMYRIGQGDCFLLTLPREGTPFHMLIDFGVKEGSERSPDILNEIINDIKQVTGGRLDVAMGTHEHLDHVSGFMDAEKAFRENLKVGEIWMAWTEDPRDPEAARIRGDKLKMCRGLEKAKARLRLAGAGEEAGDIELLEGFYARGKKKKAWEAWDILRDLAGGPGNVRYLRPERGPVRVDGVPAEFFVLGPPRDEALLRKGRPRKGEAYPFLAHQGYLDSLVPGLENREDGIPFDRQYRIPEEVAKGLPFFRSRYWADEEEAASPEPGWRRIDGAWLASAVDMALHVEGMINNSSLVLAVEIGEDVLLFTGDAQVGSWRSWKDLSWILDNGRTVTGPDLVSRTVCYKVGHHGSHNATPKDEGLERMDRLEYALLPVIPGYYSKMPRESLVKRLVERTNRKLVRLDKDHKHKDKVGGVESTDLYHELTL